jgi:hypothetical protein
MKVSTAVTEGVLSPRFLKIIVCFKKNIVIKIEHFLKIIPKSVENIFE